MEFEAANYSLEQRLRMVTDRSRDSKEQHVVSHESRERLSDVDRMNRFLQHNDNFRDPQILH